MFVVSSPQSADYASGASLHGWCIIAKVPPVYSLTTIASASMLKVMETNHESRLSYLPQATSETEVFRYTNAPLRGSYARVFERSMHA